MPVSERRILDGKVFHESCQEIVRSSLLQPEVCPSEETDRRKTGEIEELSSSGKDEEKRTTPDTTTITITTCDSSPENNDVVAEHDSSQDDDENGNEISCVPSAKSSSHNVHIPTAPGEKDSILSNGGGDSRCEEIKKEDSSDEYMMDSIQTPPDIIITQKMTREERDEEEEKSVTVPENRNLSPTPERRKMRSTPAAADVNATAADVNATAADSFSGEDEEDEKENRVKGVKDSDKNSIRDSNTRNITQSEEETPDVIKVGGVEEQKSTDDCHPQNQSAVCKRRPEKEAKITTAQLQMTKSSLVHDEERMRQLNEAKGHNRMSQSESGKKFYPTDLNPFGDDDEESHEVSNRMYPGDLNPFGDDQDESSSDKIAKENYDDSLNPFGEDDEKTEIDVRNPLPKPQRMLSPGGSSSNLSNNHPRHHQPSSPGVVLRHSSHGLLRGEPKRRSRPSLPPPPVPSTKPPLPSKPQLQVSQKTLDVPQNDSPVSPLISTPRSARKKAPAPHPPTPSNDSMGTCSLSHNSSSVQLDEENETNSDIISVSGTETPESNRSLNRRRVSLTPSVSPSVTSIDSSEVASTISPNLMAEGMSPLNENKKKKRPAPLPPTAVRRTVEGSLESIQRELNQMADRMEEVQKSVKHLEEVFQNNPDENCDEDDLIYQYLEYAKEICCMARKQEELMYQYVSSFCHLICCNVTSHHDGI